MPQLTIGQLSCFAFDHFHELVELNETPAQNERVCDRRCHHPAPVITDVGPFPQPNVIGDLVWSQVVDEECFKNDPHRINGRFVILRGHPDLRGEKRLAQNGNRPFATGVVKLELSRGIRNAHRMILAQQAGRLSYQASRKVAMRR